MNDRLTLSIYSDQEVYYIKNIYDKDQVLATISPSELILGISYVDFAHALLKNTTLRAFENFSLGYFIFNNGCELGWSERTIPDNFYILKKEFDRLKELEFYG